MRKITFLKTMLLAVFMLVGSMSVKADQETYTYTTGDGTWITENVERLYQSTNFTFLQKKNTSSSNIATTYAELRVYASHSMEVFPTIPGKTITAIEVTASSASYATAMSNATVLAGASSASANSVTGIASVNGSVTTFDLSGVTGCEYVKFSLAAQSRTLSWKVTYSSSSTTPTVATPTFNPAAGSYTSSQSVEITTTTPSASIYYTTDGSDPDNVGNGTLYSAAVPVNVTTTLKARAYATDMDPSTVATAIYTINPAPTITITEVTVPAFLAQVGQTDNETINVGGTNLTSDIILTIDGADAALFSVNSPLSSTGGVATIIYTPATAGIHSATLRINSTGAAEEIRALSGTAYVSSGVIISEVFGGGGNSGATLKNDFIELYNTTAEAITIGGWSVQYFSAAVTGEASNVFVIPEGRFIPSGAHFLIKASAGTGGTQEITDQDATSTLQLGGTAGKIILYNTSAAQTISDISSIIGNPNFVDYVPYGTTAVPVWGTAMSSNISSTTSATRNTVAPAAIGAQRVNAAVNYMYSGNIGNDFSAVAPSPTSTGISTGLKPANQLDFVYTSNGKIMFNATANQTVEVFNAVGQLIVSKSTIDGLNTISVLQKGIVLVKVGDKVSKVIL